MITVRYESFEAASSSLWTGPGFGMYFALDIFENVDVEAVLRRSGQEAVLSFKNLIYLLYIIFLCSLRISE